MRKFVTFDTLPGNPTRHTGSCIDLARLRTLMRMAMYTAAAISALACLNAGAQTVTSSNGTANSIPKYSGATTLVPSALSEVNGFVSLGTSAPANKLEVAGSTGIQVGYGGQNRAINLYENRSTNPNWVGASIDFFNPQAAYGGGLAFSYHRSNGTADGNLQTGIVLNTSGYVGIGTTQRPVLH